MLFSLPRIWTHLSPISWLRGSPLVAETLYVSSPLSPSVLQMPRLPKAQNKYVNESVKEPLFPPLPFALLHSWRS